MNARTFILADGAVTLRRSDGPTCPVWHCIISQPPRLRAALASTARDALHIARVGATAMTVTVVAPPTPPAAVSGLVSDTIPLAAVRERIQRASTESMALRHLIGTKDPLAALDVLVTEAIKAQGLGLAEFRAQQARREIEEVMRGQRRLQKELDELRAQLAAAKAKPDGEAKPGAGETTQDNAQTSPEGGAPTEIAGEASAVPASQEAQ